MPAPLYQYVEDNGSGPLVLDLSDAGARLTAAFQYRQEAHDKVRKLQRDMIDARADLERNRGNASERIEALRRDLADAVLGGDRTEPIVTADGNPDYKEADTTGRVPRTGALAQRVEDLIRFMAFHHFLETGGLLPPSACSFGRKSKGGDDDDDDDTGSRPSARASFRATDEEYLAGAMGVAQDLSRYAMGRATARDANSVQQARDLVARILDYLLKFDFRNGFLRRKYDGTKYALKAVETLLYELSITGTTAEPSADSSSSAGREEPGAKKPRLEEPPNDESASSPSLEEELEALRLRMEERDKVRETLIKKSRDGQKAAKQAIYALHRNDFSKAERLLRDCEDCINEKLLPLVREEPPLRKGCFANVLEEYAEAKLFYAWLRGNDGSGTTETAGTLLLPSDFSNVPLDLDEYIGGLCDLTGEIGRYAVRKGTVRDYRGVYRCLEANGAVFRAIQTLEKPPQRISKKMEPLRQSVSKIERMIYEISLSKAAGMRFNSDVPQDVGTTSQED